MRTDVLTCPACHGTLTEDRTTLACVGCGIAHAVDNGVAMLLRDDTHVDHGFDQRWRQNPRFQAARHADFWLKTGWKPGQMRGKVVLDGGVGVGRYLHLVHEEGADAVGIDVSPQAVRSAAGNVPGATLVHASLADRLPIRDEFIDMAYSLGVLHHTPDPARAFANLARTVKRGGSLAVWVYAKHLSDDRYWPMHDFVADVAKACPPERLYDACRKHAVAMRDAYAGDWGPLAQVVRASSSSDDAECVSDTFDWHAPQFRSWHTVDEVKSWFATAGFDVVYVGEFPVSVGGVKR